MPASCGRWGADCARWRKASECWTTASSSCAKAPCVRRRVSSCRPVHAVNDEEKTATPRTAQHSTGPARFKPDNPSLRVQFTHTLRARRTSTVSSACLWAHTSPSRATFRWAWLSSQCACCFSPSCPVSCHACAAGSATAGADAYCMRCSPCWACFWAPEFGGGIGCPPPEKNELVLSIETGCTDADLFHENQTPRSDSH